jgi:hypothetical protein
MDEQELYIAYGGELKALGDGRIGGIGVQFTGKDLEGEGFKSDTYYGARKGDGADCLFHHSLPLKGIPKELTDYLFPPVKVTPQQVGLFAETILDMANEYEKMIYDMVEAGKLGWSSGAPGHMVRKTASGVITRWPISEFSLTPCPAEPRNRVMTLKAFLTEQEEANDKKTITVNVSQVTSVRAFEEFLRDAGFAKDAATTIASKGFTALRQRDSEDDATAAIQAARQTQARLAESRLLTGVSV